MRPSVQLAGLLAEAVQIPPEQQTEFVHLARQTRGPASLPAIAPLPEEIGAADLSGRAIKGFLLAERIGSGGMGVVYRATQQSVDRDVAVKIIHPHIANQAHFIRQFEAEARLVASLEHPHIVPLYLRSAIPEKFQFCYDDSHSEPYVMVRESGVSSSCISHIQ